MAKPTDRSRSQEIVTDANDVSATEERPLLRSFPNPSGYGIRTRTSKQQRAPISTRVKQHLSADINNRWTDLVLIVCFFISGLIDAGAYNAYECFSSMQTGNTVFAALGVSGLPASSASLGWTKSVCSTVCYLLGAMATASFHRTFGERKRWVLAFSFTLQAVFILISAILVKQRFSSGSPSSGERFLFMLPADPGFPLADLIPIGLLSFQAAAKVIASRMLECNSLPVVVLTTLYADLVSDPSLFSGGLFNHSQRNRRAGGVVFYFTGAVVGGVAASHAIGFGGGLLIAAAIQLATAVVWLLWRHESEGNSNEEEQI